jgi:hypothetical protein
MEKVIHFIHSVHFSPQTPLYYYCFNDYKKIILYKGARGWWSFLFRKLLVLGKQLSRGIL